MMRKKSHGKCRHFFASTKQARHHHSQRESERSSDAALEEGKEMRKNACDQKIRPKPKANHVIKGAAQLHTILRTTRFTVSEQLVMQSSSVVPLPEEFILMPSWNS